MTCDARALRDAFGCFMTGVTVVTTSGSDGKPLGFTANSFSSVSLDPPLVLISIANSSANHGAFAGGAGFAVNVLAEGQKAISGTFARPADDRFEGLYWKRGPAGNPVIADVAAWFDCTLEQAVPAGDHTVLIGRVMGFEATAAAGLGYYRGAYVTPAATAAAMPMGPDVVISAVLECEGQVLLVDDGRGGLSVPMARVGREGVAAAFAGLIAGVGVQAGAGSIYAVYEDAGTGVQHIALRAVAAGRPLRGGFVELTAAGVADVTDPGTRAMLERLAEESRMGNYRVYFGSHLAGRVS